MLPRMANILTGVVGQELLGVEIGLCLGISNSGEVGTLWDNRQLTSSQFPPRKAELRVAPPKATKPGDFLMELELDVRRSASLKFLSIINLW